MLVRSFAGYDYGKVQPSSVTLDEFKRLQSVVGFTDQGGDLDSDPLEPPLH